MFLPRLRRLALSLVALGLVAGRSELAPAEEPISPDEGRPRVKWEDAGQVVGKVAFVYGKVIAAREMANINFINFDAKRPAEFAAVVFKDNRDKFPPSLKDAYVGKTVQLRGMVSTFQNKPQMVLSDPAQITILEKMPEITTMTPPPQGAKEGELVIGAYNILNLFDNVDDPYYGDEGTPAKPRKELQALAKSIHELNADVLALEEVENRGYLERFVSVFLADMGYKHVVHFEGNDTRGIDVCMLSRVPVGVVKSHRHITFPGPQGEPRQFSRDILAVELLPPGGKPLQAWALHLKSNSGGREFSEPVRLAEAKALRKLLDAELTAHPDEEIIVMGDYNDQWETPTMTTIVGQGPTAMWSVASELLPEQPDTYNTGEHQSMIDFLLCSPALAKRYVKGSLRIVPGSPESTGSDHNPIVATFKVN